MRRVWGWTLVLLLLSGCYWRQDPLVRAAQDLQEMSYEFARQEEERRQQFNLLALGMSDDEVLTRVGPPTSRRSLEDNSDERRERWTYQRSMRAPATLTFTNQRLTEITLE